jgi:hypothetical protein
VKRKLIIGLGIFLVLVAVAGFLFYKRKNYQPKPGSCLILEEKYCKRGKLLTSPGRDGDMVVGFNLPQGTIVFSPDDGYFSSVLSILEKKPNEKTSPAILIESTKGSQVYYYRLVTNLSKEEMWKSKKVGKGEALTILNDENIDFFGDYNLVFSLIGYDKSEEKIILTQEEVKKMFNLIKN